MSNVRQRDAFSSTALTRSDSTARSRNESGSEFQTVGPAVQLSESVFSRLLDSLYGVAMDEWISNTHTHTQLLTHHRHLNFEETLQM